MGQKMVCFAELCGTRSRQDEPKEVHEAGRIRPSSGSNGGHVLSLYPLIWRSLIRRLLVPATCDATHRIDVIGPCDALAAARMAKCVAMPSQQFAHRDKPRGRPHPHTANSGRYRAFLLRKNARQNARQNARWHLPRRAFPAVRSQNARLPCVSYRAFHIFC
jgi:hypothetical protein